MRSVASVAESLAFAAITPDRNGPKALIFMQAVAGGGHPKCSREHFREICHCLVHAAPFYTEYLAQLAQTLGKNESLAPLRDILREELSAQMPTLRERMYEATRRAMEKFHSPCSRQEDEWIGYLKDCFQYPELGQLVGEVALEVFGLPESPEHSLRRGQGGIEDPQQAWREMVLERALSAMRTGESACFHENKPPLEERAPVFAPV